MALSDYERKMLEELESQLHSDDPKLSETLRSEKTTATQLSIAPKNLVGGIVIIILGLAVVIAGVAAEIVPIGVGGVAVVFAGFWYLSSGFVRKEKKVTSPKRPKGASLSFFEKQAEEWLRRQKGQ